MSFKLWYISNRFFENGPSEIYSHLSEKGPKGRFLRAERLENHTSKGEGKEKRNRRSEDGEKREIEKKQWLHSQFLYRLKKTA